MQEPTELDHQGAVIWVSCPLCGADRGASCVSVFFLGPNLILYPPGTDKVHDMRLQKWLGFKARVVAGAKSYRIPNLQQVPRKKYQLR